MLESRVIRGYMVVTCEERSDEVSTERRSYFLNPDLCREVVYYRRDVRQLVISLFDDGYFSVGDRVEIEETRK